MTLPICSAEGCTNQIDPRWYFHGSDGRPVPACDAHGMTAEQCQAPRKVCACPKAKASPTQPKKTIEEIRAIVDAVAFMDRKLRLAPMGDGVFVQVQYLEADVITGEVELQSARKWYVSPFSTESEIVETVFKACRVSMEHVVKEHFTYRGRRVYSPHFDVQARIDACDAGRFDGRIPRRVT